MEAPDWKRDDLCCTSMYDGSIIYRIVCFFDRGNAEACSLHQNIDPKEGVDDVHLEVVWKKHRAIAPSWPVGTSTTANVSQLRLPNPLLALALVAE